MISPAPVLSDGKTTLTAPRPEDAEAVLAAEDDVIRWAWDAKHPVTLAEAQRRITTAMAYWLNGTPDWRFAVRAADAPTLVGWTRLHLRQDGGAALDLWIAPKHRRAGHALRAVRLVCQYGFEDRQLPWIGVEIKPANTDSLALAAAAGFEPNSQGVIRNEQGIFLTRYWLTAEQWRAAN